MLLFSGFSKGKYTIKGTLEQIRDAQVIIQENLSRFLQHSPEERTSVQYSSHNAPLSQDASLKLAAGPHEAFDASQLHSLEPPRIGSTLHCDETLLKPEPVHGGYQSLPRGKMHLKQEPASHGGGTPEDQQHLIQDPEKTEVNTSREVPAESGPPQLLTAKTSAKPTAKDLSTISMTKATSIDTDSQGSSASSKFTTSSSSGFISSRSSMYHDALETQAEDTKEDETDQKLEDSHGQASSGFMNKTGDIPIDAATQLRELPSQTASSTTSKASVAASRPSTEQHISEQSHDQTTSEFTEKAEHSNTDTAMKSGELTAQEASATTPSMPPTQSMQDQTQEQIPSEFPNKREYNPTDRATQLREPPRQTASATRSSNTTNQSMQDQSQDQASPECTNRVLTSYTEEPHTAPVPLHLEEVCMDTDMWYYIAKVQSHELRNIKSEFDVSITSEENEAITTVRHV